MATVLPLISLVSLTGLLTSCGSNSADPSTPRATVTSAVVTSGTSTCSNPETNAIGSGDYGQIENNISLLASVSIRTSASGVTVAWNTVAPIQQLTGGQPVGYTVTATSNSKNLTDPLKDSQFVVQDQGTTMSPQGTLTVGGWTQATGTTRFVPISSPVENNSVIAHFPISSLHSLKSPFKWYAEEVGTFAFETTAGQVTDYCPQPSGGDSIRGGPKYRISDYPVFVNGKNNGSGISARNQSTPSTSTTSPATATHGQLPSVESCVEPSSSSTDTIRPSYFGFGCAGLHVNVTAIIWNTYSASSATGTGELEYNDCTPSCGAGTEHYSQATVTLSNPEMANGVLVFQSADEVPVSGNGPTEQSSDPGAGWGTSCQLASQGGLGCVSTG